MKTRTVTFKLHVPHKSYHAPDYASVLASSIKMILVTSAGYEHSPCIASKQTN